ncbi:MAG: N-glycosylase/DNA lyase [Candidatus Njordarchaeales archaeon]
MSERLTRTRSEELINILREFSIDEVLSIEKKFDEQFHALKYLYHNCLQDCRVYLVLIVLNALSSYMLNCTGEEYWWEFSRYFCSSRNMIKKLESTGIINVFKDFLRRSKCNKRFLETKLRRVDRVIQLINSLIQDIDAYACSSEKLLEELVERLGGRRDAKTLVFTVKMFNYGLRICTGQRYVLPFTISIPVDNRISKISNALGIKQRITEFWNNVSKIVKIPPLHIDSLLWVAYRYMKRREKTGHRKFDRLILFLQKILIENTFA